GLRVEGIDSPRMLVCAARQGAEGPGRAAVAGLAGALAAVAADDLAVGRPDAARAVLAAAGGRRRGEGGGQTGAGESACEGRKRTVQERGTDGGQRKKVQSARSKRPR